MTRSVMPVGPADAYKTYAVGRPAATHFRPAACAEVGCAAHARGWVTRVDESTDLGQGQAHYIRTDRTRRCRETRNEDGTTWFVFEPGQTCFVEHRLPNSRPELYVVRHGDWRGNPSGDRAVLRCGEWVDSFQEHAGKLADLRRRG